jgi:putative addiction module component (TIGR02574 family)
MCARLPYMKLSGADTLDLPISERIQLVTEIWESIAECPESIELTEATRQLLRARLNAHRKNPTAGSPWSELRERLTRE